MKIVDDLEHWTVVIASKESLPREHNFGLLYYTVDTRQTWVSMSDGYGWHTYWKVVRDFIEEENKARAASVWDNELVLEA